MAKLPGQASSTGWQALKSGHGHHGVAEHGMDTKARGTTGGWAVTAAMRGVLQ